MLNEVNAVFVTALIVRLDITDQISGVFDSASAAGPLVLLSLVILLGIVAMIVISWKMLPILKALVDTIPQAIRDVKSDAVEGNQTAKANSGAVADLTESVSQFMAVVNGVQEKHGENQVAISASQEKLGEHFIQSVDVLSKISTRLSTQSTQMDMLVGDSTVTRETVNKTAESVNEIKTSINQGVEQLAKINRLLEEIKAYNDNHHCIQQADFDRLVTSWSAAKQEILDAVKGVLEPVKLTAPSTAMAYEVEVETKKETSGEKV